MRTRTFLPFLLPIVPILCLGIALLILVISLEYNTYSATFGIPAPTASPAATVNGTGTAGVPAAGTAPGTVSSDLEKQRERFFNVIKDVALVVAASIITFSSSYVGGLIQSNLQKQQETRQERREQVKKYKEYLEWIFRTGQRKSLLDRVPILKQFLPKQGSAFKVDESTIQKAVTDMPVALGLQALDDECLQEEFDDLVIEAVGYLTQISIGKKPDYKTLNQKYNSVLKGLNAYVERE